MTKILKAAAEFSSTLSSNGSDESKFDAIEEEIYTFVQSLKVVNDSLSTVNQTIQETEIINPKQLGQNSVKTAEYEDSAIGCIKDWEQLRRSFLENEDLTFAWHCLEVIREW